MKKILCAFLALTMLATGLKADEGMWLLPLLEKLNIKTMNQMGCRLSADQIYNVNNSSLKDAVVMFANYCTGEVISGEGLLVTNHHCGYSSIQGISTPDHNYLEDGYWAMQRSEEIPIKGLSVTFLQSMTDVTGILAKGASSRKKLMKMAKADNPHCDVDIVSYFNGNAQYMIVTKTYKDVRFVGAPPASVGKFGGETDNWMWPRHTGDFSMFRIYAGADNEPAMYSADNKPYDPKGHLKISLKGYGEGDFSMVMGYPGSTQRYQTAAQLEQMIQTQNKAVQEITVWKDAVNPFMEANPSIRLQYADKYAEMCNAWKNYQGENEAVKKLGIIQAQKQKEAAFMQWVDSSDARQKKYGDALAQIQENVDKQGPVMIPLMTSSLMIEMVDAFNRAFSQKSSDTSSVKESYDTTVEKKAAIALLDYYRKNVPPEDYIHDFGTGDFRKADISTLDVEGYVNDFYRRSSYTSDERLAQAKQNSGTRKELKDDPARRIRKAVMVNAIKPVIRYSRYDAAVSKASKVYTAGLLEWEKDKIHYPDANMTMRLSYGSVKTFTPEGGAPYKYYTTLDGVMAKEDSTNYEFIVPKKLKALYQAKDYGQYATPDGEMRVCFLTDNDITGGNSGSPVMNGDGELIGLAFDGNWESLSSDIRYNADLQRCICVDIRYVLFMMDKFGGAGYLLDEMDIVK